MPAFTTKIDNQSEDFRKNTEQMGKLVEDLRQKLQKSALGGSEKARKNTLIAENFCHVSGCVCYLTQAVLF